MRAVVSTAFGFSPISVAQNSPFRGFGDQPLR
jgi:hypothetical protein